MKKFEHDCDKCNFIGHFEGHDVYECPQGGMPTIVARYGDEGSHYSSCAVCNFFHVVNQFGGVGTEVDYFKAMFAGLAEIGIRDVRARLEDERNG